MGLPHERTRPPTKFPTSQTIATLSFPSLGYYARSTAPPSGLAFLFSTRNNSLPGAIQGEARTSSPWGPPGLSDPVLLLHLLSFSFMTVCNEIQVFFSNLSPPPTSYVWDACLLGFSTFSLVDIFARRQAISPNT